MKEASLESQVFTATKEKRRMRLDSYSKEMWAARSCHIEKRSFLNIGSNSCVKFSCCLNTHYLAAETPPMHGSIYARVTGSFIDY